MSDRAPVVQRLGRGSYIPNIRVRVPAGVPKELIEVLESLRIVVTSTELEFTTSEDRNA